MLDPAREQAHVRVRGASAGGHLRRRSMRDMRRLGAVLGLALLVLFALIPASGALAAAGSSSQRRHAKARVGHRRVRHTARCARRPRHGRYHRVRHATRGHSRAHRSRYSSCGSGAHRRHHHSRARKHHAAVHRSAPPRPPVSHATASAGPNGTVTPAAPGAL